MVFNFSNFSHSDGCVFHSHLNCIHWMINVLGTILYIYCQFVLFIVSLKTLPTPVSQGYIYFFKTTLFV